MKPSESDQETIDSYIRNAPESVRQRLEEIRATIREAAPEAAETIKYRLPTFTMKKNLVHFGVFENHIGFYPSPSGIEAFRDELSGYRSSKGAVQFPLDKPIPLDLIRRIVAFRVQEVEAAEKLKRKKPG